MWRMVVDCPECGASLEGTSGAEMVCPACMTPFLVPSSARAVRSFDVQPAGDAILHNVSRYAIREAIYGGRLTVAARVRHGGGPDQGKWELIGGYPEFASVFRLLGGDLAPMAGTRKLAGWKRAGPDASGLRAPRATAPVAPPPMANADAEHPIAALEAPSPGAPVRPAPRSDEARPAARASGGRPATPPRSARPLDPRVLAGGLVILALAAAAGLLLR